jgi:hypothetical protein
MRPTSAYTAIFRSLRSRLAYGDRLPCCHGRRITLDGHRLPRLHRELILLKWTSPWNKYPGEREGRRPSYRSIPAPFLANGTLTLCGPCRDIEDAENVILSISSLQASALDKKAGAGRPSKRWARGERSDRSECSLTAIFSEPKKRPC